MMGLCTCSCMSVRTCYGALVSRHYVSSKVLEGCCGYGVVRGVYYRVVI